MLIISNSNFIAVRPTYEDVFKYIIVNIENKEINEHSEFKIEKGVYKNYEFTLFKTRKNEEILVLDDTLNKLKFVRTYNSTVKRGTFLFLDFICQYKLTKQYQTIPNKNYQNSF